MSETKYYAHTAVDAGGKQLPESSGKWQPLKDHLQNVAVLARRFAAEARPGDKEFAAAAEAAGLLHDLGKYREEFQEYLAGERPGGIETHHAVYGAAMARSKDCLGLTFSIAGHHTGLYDKGGLDSLIEDGKYSATTKFPALENRLCKEVGPIKDIKDPSFCDNDFSVDFYVRMLFSCLIDADRLDASGESEKYTPSSLTPGDMLKQLGKAISEKESGGEVNGVRNEILNACLKAGEFTQGFYSLTVPTGAGKTLSSMAFALKHAQKWNLQRIIVVIPYLSIIEQNAAEYKRIFNSGNRDIVIENHTAVKRILQPTNETNINGPDSIELTAENWDAPVIVTTSVQFLESLFAAAPSRCRKLHNIARSIVIFDEVQTLPTYLLNPALNVFRELRKHYGTSFLFCTATQPAFKHSLTFTEGFAAEEMKEISPDLQGIYRKLNRVKYHSPEKDKTVSWSELAAEIVGHPQVLCVVNTRKHAFELWDEVRRKVGNQDRDSVFHLSSALCPAHRQEVLGDAQSPSSASIRGRLKSGNPCRVISTQLVEAGVDLDFPVVYRAFGPLDSIVQVGGRCNREGLLKDKNGNLCSGDVFIFSPEESGLPRGLYTTATAIAAGKLASYKKDELSVRPEIFTEYFSELYSLSGADYQRRGQDNIQQDRQELRFREVQRKAKVIQDNTTPVIVQYGEAKDVICAIRKNFSFNRTQLRFLQHFMVNLMERDFNKLQAQKQIRPLLENTEIFVLDDGSYNEKFNLGVLIDKRPVEDYCQ